MLEIRNNDKTKISNDYVLYIDGDLVDEAEIFYETGNLAQDRPYSIMSLSSEVGERIAAHSLNQIPKVANLSLVLNLEPFDYIQSVSISYERWARESELCWTARFHFGHFSRWRAAHSFAEFFEQLTHVIASKNSSDIRFFNLDNVPEYLEIPYTLSLRPVSEEIALLTEIHRLCGTIQQLFVETERALSTPNEENFVSMSFDFPEEVRVPCEQYLLYFGKFLQDLGVRATSDLQHNAGQVLFTVTPADSQTALDKIRAALDVYLQLPSSPVSDTSHAEIAIQRLEANVLRVKSDLKLAAAELQAKNTTIEAQRLIIETQKGLLSGEIVFNSIKDVTPKPEDKEELLGGIVALATYKDKGVEINLAELYRKLRTLFKDDE